MATLITEDDARALLLELPGWTYARNGIEREYTFAGFPEAVAFVNRLVAPSEDADHHPDIQIHYRRVLVRYTTHSAPGLTEKDFAGARQADEAAAA
jgi:4a-hydroxytetrahydrobiopterin dehydratase